MSTVDAPDLRERRRVQTEREINDAALVLFERDGVDSTRVEDIARDAGVSPRTFFRYFPTKEAAAFWREPELTTLVAEMTDGLRADRPVLPQVEAIYVAAMEAFENGASEPGRRILRLWRLIAAEPHLRAAGLAAEEARIQPVVDRVRELLDAGPDDLRPALLVEAAAGTARVAFERWASATDRGEPADLLALYAQAREELRALTRG